MSTTAPPRPTLTPDESRFIRERARMTRRELADFLGVHEETIRGWESPEDDPHHRVIRPWAAKLLRELETRTFSGG